MKSIWQASATTALFLSVGLLLTASAGAAPPCKGPNSNDPGCPGAEAVLADPVVINSVTVDWYNQRLVVRGSGFLATTAFTLGSDPVPVAATLISAQEIQIEFTAQLAAQVFSEGNFNLVADGSESLSVYIEDQIIDPAATGCPCATEWAAASYSGFIWGDQTADCLEVTGPGSNDPADIAGTILSNPADPAVFPQYPIGASFYPGNPASSECRLAEVAADASVTDLVRYRINELQQADCATVLKANVCSVTP